MTMSLLLVGAMVIMFAVGIYMMLDRSLTRILLGFMLVGNGANLLIFLMSGSFGSAPIVGEDGNEISDPLPQAFILTAIVITFGVTAFVLALMYRSWRLSQEQEDSVEDDSDATRLTESDDTLTLEEVTDTDLSEAHEFEEDTDNDGYEHETNELNSESDQNGEGVTR